MKLLGIKHPGDLREHTVNHTRKTHEIYMVHPIWTITSTVDSNRFTRRSPHNKNNPLLVYTRVQAPTLS